jgi:phage tail tape-measure protein
MLSLVQRSCVPLPKKKQIFATILFHFGVIHDQDQPERGICSLDAASSSDARLEVVNSIGNIDLVGKVARSDNKTATADTVRKVAESECFLSGEVGDLATLLRVASVAVKHDTSDLVLDGSGETPAFGKNIRTKGGIVGASNTLAGDIVGAVGRLQALASRGANSTALFNRNMSTGEGYIDWILWACIRCCHLQWIHERR